MNAEKFKVIIVFVLIISLFVGYATGRGFKTYEINTEIKINDLKKIELDKQAILNNASNTDDTIVVAPNRVVPQVKLKLSKDSISGFNLYIDTQAFLFTPQDLGKNIYQNTGYAKILVNGKKIGRAYSPWFYINNETFKSGTNTITVILDANNQADWITKNGKVVSASMQISTYSSTN